MKKSKLFSIISIICFCSVVLIPIGLALMWFSTEWKKKIKIIISSVLGPLYIVLVLLLLFLEPSYNTGGISLPFGYSKGSSAVAENKKGKNKNSSLDSDNSEFLKELGIESEKGERLPKSLKKQSGKNVSRTWIAVLFFLFLTLIVILQNLRNKNKKTGYENPYVDTNQYKLPFSENSKMPMVHFLALHLNAAEKILYATETKQPGNEGNFVVTNQRVVLFSKEGDVEFPLNALTAISSVSNSVLLLTSGERKYYIFVPENQMRYALAVVRWAYAQPR